MNYLDIIIIAIIILNTGLGFFRGLIKSVISIISIICGFIAAKIFYLDFLGFLNKNFDLVNNIKSNIIGFLGNIKLPTTVDVNSVNVEGLDDKIKIMKPIINKFLEDKKVDLISSGNFVDQFSDWLADKLGVLISMVVLFVIVLLVVRIIGFIINKLFELPVLREVNKVAGTLFGLLKGVVYSMLIVILITLFAPVFGGGEILSALNNSFIAIYFYKYNLFVIIFDMLI